MRQDVTVLPWFRRNFCSFWHLCHSYQEVPGGAIRFVGTHDFGLWAHDHAGQHFKYVSSLPLTLIPCRIGSMRWL